MVCWLWTGLLVVLYCLTLSGIEKNSIEEYSGVVACLVMVPWIIGWTVPFLWRYIVYGSAKRYY